jgi:hypothetical protein
VDLACTMIRDLYSAKSASLLVGKTLHPGLDTHLDHVISGNELQSHTQIGAFLDGDPEIEL